VNGRPRLGAPPQAVLRRAGPPLRGADLQLGLEEARRDLGAEVGGALRVAEHPVMAVDR
jgi:hypothetical protein